MKVQNQMLQHRISIINY